MNAEQAVPQPDRIHLVAEIPRLFSEIASILPSAPFISQAPRGDGHAVLVLPGLGGGDTSTRFLRRYLTRLGHDAHPWTLGQNQGPRMPDLRQKLADRLDALHRRGGGRKVSLVGWSLGGVYARVLAHRYPEKIRQVLTLGSPIGGETRSVYGHDEAGVSTQSLHDGDDRRHQWAFAAPPLPGRVPSSALFSKTDGIVPWQVAIQEPGDFAENIEIYGSHIGLGFNPTVLFAVADRLALPEDAWAPFGRNGWKRFAYGKPVRANDF